MKLSKPSRVIIVAAVIIAVAALLCFDPSTSGFFPRCIFKTLTGYDCPGCGTQRAIHQLLHGNIAAAWHYNPAIFFAAAAIAFDIIARRLRRPNVLTRFVQSPAWPITLLVITLLWWLLRNIPCLI